MALSSVIIKRLGIRAGIDVTTPAGATVLAYDIESKTGQRLAANTIKRLLGILPYNGTPRKTTLNIIAKYIGFRSWDQLMDIVSEGMSLFGDVYPYINIRELPVNALIHFKWEPGRSITLRHISMNACEVEAVENSRLKKGDKLVVIQLGEGFPFYARKVTRGEEDLGTYSAAVENGIYDLKIEEPSMPAQGK